MYNNLNSNGTIVENYGGDLDYAEEYVEDVFDPEAASGAYYDDGYIEEGFDDEVAEDAYDDEVADGAYEDDDLYEDYGGDDATEAIDDDDDDDDDGDYEYSEATYDDDVYDD